MAFHMYVPLLLVRACGHMWLSGWQVHRAPDEMVTYAFVISGKKVVTNTEKICETA